jgi:BMFP domain-containing protein YqiC
MDPKIIDDIANRLHNAMPSGMRTLQGDLEKNLRAAIQSALAKLDLVTREEFDVQTQVLLRTRERLDAMTRRVEALEKQVLGKGRNEAEPAEPLSDNDMDGG